MNEIDIAAMSDQSVEAFYAEARVPTAGWSTCPGCARRWLVTPGDDCMVPACGCFGDDTSAANPDRPCDSCGLRHAWNCLSLPRSVNP